jgi:hypothetical protein
MLAIFPLRKSAFNRESEETNVEHQFAVEHPPGYYYVQVRVILFRAGGGKVFAQAEQFFFARRPIHIIQDSEVRVTFPVSWPSEPLETLHKYGTISPQSKRPWWKFW